MERQHGNANIDRLLRRVLVPGLVVMPSDAEVARLGVRIMNSIKGVEQEGSDMSHEKRSGKLRLAWDGATQGLERPMSASDPILLSSEAMAEHAANSKKPAEAKPDHEMPHPTPEEAAEIARQFAEQEQLRRGIF